VDISKVQKFKIGTYYLILFFWDLLLSYILFRGHVIYAGDQGFIIYPHITFNYLEWGDVVPYTNYPYGFVPIVAPNSWVYWLTVPFEVFGSYGEEIFTLVLMYIGTVFTFKLAQIYFSKRASLLGSMIFPSSWYLFSSGSISSSIFFNDLFTYFSLPVLTYFVVAFSKGKIPFYKYFFVFSLIAFISLTASADVIPFEFVYLVIILVYFIRKFNAITASILSMILGQLYWLHLAVAPTVSYFSGIANTSLSIYTGLQTYTPLSLTIRSLGAVSITYIPSYVLLLSLIIPPVLTLPLLKKRRDLAFFYFIWILGVGLLSSYTTPFRPLIEYGILHSGLFAPFRDAPLFLSPVISLPYALLFSAFLEELLKFKAGLIASLMLFLVLSVVIPYPVMISYNSGRISIPQQFIKTITYLNEQDGDFTVLLLPFPVCGWYGTSWYYGNNIFLYFLKNPLLAGGTYSGGEFRELSTKLNYLIYIIQEENNVSPSLQSIKNLLLLFNVKYIVVEEDAQNVGIVNLVYLPPQNYTVSLGILQKFGIVNLVENYSPFLIYKVNLNTSYVYETNSSNITLNENLSSVLKPVEFTFNGYQITFNVSNYRHILLTFAYSPDWKIQGKMGYNISGFIMYNVSDNGKVTIYNSLTPKLYLSYGIAIVYLVVLFLYTYILRKYGSSRVLFIRVLKVFRAFLIKK
jgi:hypothetical protein